MHDVWKENFHKLFYSYVLVLLTIHKGIGGGGTQGSTATSTYIVYYYITATPFFNFCYFYFQISLQATRIVGVEHL